MKQVTNKMIAQRVFELIEEEELKLNTLKRVDFENVYRDLREEIGNPVKKPLTEYYSFPGYIPPSRWALNEERVGPIKKELYALVLTEENHWRCLECGSKLVREG